MASAADAANAAAATADAAAAVGLTPAQLEALYASDEFTQGNKGPNDPEYRIRDATLQHILDRLTVMENKKVQDRNMLKKTWWQSSDWGSHPDEGRWFPSQVELPTRAKQYMSIGQRIKQLKGQGNRNDDMMFNRRELPSYAAGSDLPTADSGEATGDGAKILQMGTSQIGNYLKTGFVRGQLGVPTWEKEMVELTGNMFFNYTFFPVVFRRRNDKQQAVVGGVTSAYDTQFVYVTQLYCCVYTNIDMRNNRDRDPLPTQTTGAAAGAPREGLLLYPPRYVQYSVADPNGRTRAVVNVDVTFVGGQDAERSILAALTTANPEHGSFLYIFPYIDPQFWVGTVNVRSWQCQGASMGLAVAACALGLPGVVYTGYMNQIEPDKVLTNYTALQDVAQVIPRSVGIVESVDDMAFKMLHVLQRNTPLKVAPLVFPYVSQYGSPLVDTFMRDLSMSTSLRNLGASIAYSVAQMEMGVPIEKFDTPLFCAGTIADVVVMSAYAWGCGGTTIDERFVTDAGNKIEAVDVLAVDAAGRASLNIANNEYVARHAADVVAMLNDPQTGIDAEKAKGILAMLTGPLANTAAGVTENDVRKRIIDQHYANLQRREFNQKTLGHAGLGNLYLARAINAVNRAKEMQKGTQDKRQIKLQAAAAHMESIKDKDKQIRAEYANKNVRSSNLKKGIKEMKQTLAFKKGPGKRQEGADSRVAMKRYMAPRVLTTQKQRQLDRVQQSKEASEYGAIQRNVAARIAKAQATQMARARGEIASVPKQSFRQATARREQALQETEKNIGALARFARQVPPTRAASEAQPATQSQQGRGASDIPPAAAWLSPVPAAQAATIKALPYGSMQTWNRMLRGYRTDMGLPPDALVAATDLIRSNRFNDEDDLVVLGKVAGLTLDGVRQLMASANAGP